jgi:indolepyruvate ferredoxin oxidoreductase beta subunit
MDAQVSEQLSKVRPITIAVLALGGEGGGVLADWIVDVAQHSGFLAQATSVPGVAQRTGATVYYLELFPKAAAQAAGRQPVLGLLPMPGDVDVVLASELMEAARAVERGFVTPDKTLLIASTHRVFAMTERIALADGRVDSAALLRGCREAARQLIVFDMAALADATASVVSAVLFGALAGTGILPIPRMAFETAIRRGQVGVAASLAAFGAGYEAARSDAAPIAVPLPDHFEDDGSSAASEWALSAAGECTREARAVIAAAIDRLADYQDRDYAGDFLARLKRFRDMEARFGDGSEQLLVEVARQLAVGMSYEDTIRVAELKLRPSRFARVREEVQAAPEQILEIAEFFHPRVQEVADTLPAAAGQWLLDSSWARRLLERLLRRGKVVRTTSVSGFFLLYALTRLKPLRRRSLRFGNERAAVDAWLELVAQCASTDYALAVEVARMRGLVKGYGETLERGRTKFEKLATVLPRLRDSADAAALLSGLIKAALADEEGRALDKAIAELQPCPAVAADSAESTQYRKQRARSS